jgi:thiol-disulfide isomerase/thioredoxin
MNRVIVTALLLFAGGLRAQTTPIAATTADKLMARTAAGKDTTYIINFWATWCAPCVAELPQFTALQNHYKGRKVRVLLISMDFPDAYPAKLQAYVKRKALQPEVVWFSETNANEFIPKIDNAWSGALPGTLIVNSARGYKAFMEKSVTEAEVTRLVDGIQ